MRRLSARVETWPIAGRFAISRGSRTEIVVIVAEIEDGAHVGRGECVPYARYGETVDGVRGAILAQAGALEAGASRDALQHLMPAGAARNALDCALWDLEAKQAGRRAYELAGLPAPRPLVTAYTLSLDAPQAMYDAARKAGHRPLLKVKLGGDGDAERIAAVREGAPAARLIVDANEAWRETDLAANFAACARAGVELVEQPLPAADDDALRATDRPIPVCADESAHDRAGLDALVGKYDAINIKLDKTGGLTEALLLARDAETRGMALMIGCMLGTSLAMAPACLVAQGAAFVDLDGPLLLAADRQPGLAYEGSLLHPPEASLWG